MRETRIRLASYVLSVLSILTLTSCGQSEMNSGALALEIKPSAAIISPNAARNCRDIVESAEDPSISSPSVLFSNFILEWDSADDFYVAAIRVKITGAGIQGGEQILYLSSEDIEYMLGRPSGYIKGSNTRQIIQSIDPNRRTSQDSTAGTLPPCPIAFGPINLTNGTETPSFSALIEIDMVGTAISSAGTQYFVRATTTGTADHVAY